MTSRSRRTSKPDLADRHVANLSLVRRTPLLRRGRLADVRHGHPEQLVDRPHPLRVTAGQVVVDRQYVHPATADRVPSRGERTGERLALTGRHLDHATLHHRQRTDDLAVERRLTQRPPGRVPGQRQELDLLVLVQPTGGPEVADGLGQLLVGQRLDRLLRLENQLREPFVRAEVDRPGALEEATKARGDFQSHNDGNVQVGRVVPQTRSACLRTPLVRRGGGDRRAGPVSAGSGGSPQRRRREGIRSRAPWPAGPGAPAASCRGPAAATPTACRRPTGWRSPCPGGTGSRPRKRPAPPVRAARPRSGTPTAAPGTSAPHPPAAPRPRSARCATASPSVRRSGGSRSARRLRAVPPSTAARTVAR